jgi:hypothetical protein
MSACIPTEIDISPPEKMNFTTERAAFPLSLAQPEGLHSSSKILFQRWAKAKQVNVAYKCVVAWIQMQG